ncbi:glycosyltransferase [Halanaerobacter jeridensis]|uniref:Glycosyltransferase involved in cell wall biosynthesis n=1 Tax=Halanaerobacter jeridensis TaxID=706427 RepID=A0A939BMM3_9FIRM|nr:glycosyltransferase [Halanaerobacter jeridensis]MBM7556940.1 glycosyltransferase involved in cell wall biosynthesis [Halanaerobacter jeridensis]
MQIAYVYGSKWPSEGPAGSFCTFTCHGLANNTNENIYLFASKNTDKDINEVLKNYYFLEPLSNLKIKLVDDSAMIGRVTKFYIKAFNKIRKLIKKNKIDAVITRKTGFLPYMYFLKKIYGVKIFFETHDFYLDMNRRDEDDRKKKELFEKIFLPKVDGIITHQINLRNLYKEYLPQQNYCVARTGIREVIKVDNSFENEYLGYIGSLKKRKKISDILYALARVKNEDLKLLIVGGRNNKRVDEILSLAQDLGIRDRVKVTGWVSRKKVEKYLKMMKIGMVPLADSFFNRYLTSPMKIFNYFSHGIPVIGTDLPTIREIVTDKCGLFYEHDRIDQLVYAINKLDSSEEVYNKFSNNVVERAKELLWDERGKKILDFINS